jgi:SAM-dependent methyltransferase
MQSESHNGSKHSELEFYCPQCRCVSQMTLANTLCPSCHYSFIEEGGIFNFVKVTTKSYEKKYYDEEYSRTKHPLKKMARNELLSFWNRDDTPEHEILWQELTHLKGKSVLLIGNGVSAKEFLFLEQEPWRFVYSDLSPLALQAVSKSYDLSGDADRTHFVAMDAEHIPFVDESFDLVYGYGVVHHLPNLEEFIAGVARILKSDGKAVFFDDAYSWVWHYSKQTWLKPLMKYSHKRMPISPEDYRFSMAGGFKEKDLERLIRAKGAVAFFRRDNFLPYIWSRGVEKLLPPGLSSRLRKGIFMRMLVRVDRVLSLIPFYKKCQIRLIWGFTVR